MAEPEQKLEYQIDPHKFYNPQKKHLPDTKDYWHLVISGVSLSLRLQQVFYMHLTLTNLSS